MKRIYYRELRKLMADYAVDKSDIAKIIKKTYRQTSRILHRENSKQTGNPYIFDLCEAVKIVLYFRNRRLQEWEANNPDANDTEKIKVIEKINEEISMDNIFFNDMVSIESEPA